MKSLNRKRKRIEITKELLASARAGNRDAAQQILSGMEGHAKTVAKSFSSRYPALDMDDMIQTCYVAILVSIKKYDPNLGKAEFRTYAYEAMLNACRKEANKSAKVTGNEVGQDQESLDRIVDVMPSVFAANLEGFEGLDQIEAQVIIARLEPVFGGDRARPWKTVATMMGLPEDDCVAIFDRAIIKVRVAHGEADEV